MLLSAYAMLQLNHFAAPASLFVEEFPNFRPMRFWLDCECEHLMGISVYVDFNRFPTASIQTNDSHIF